MTKAEMILKALQMAGPRGVLNKDLAQYSLRYGDVLFRLRNAGYIINTDHVTEGVFKYVLTGRTGKTFRQLRAGDEVRLVKCEGSVLWTQKGGLVPGKSVLTVGNVYKVKKAADGMYAYIFTDAPGTNWATYPATKDCIEYVTEV